MINLEKWNSLPKAYQAALNNACATANTVMQAKYDLQNPAALRRLVAAGTQLRPFPQEVMEAAFNASNQIYAEISAKNADFKKIIDAMQATRSEQYLWWQVAEFTFDAFMIRARARAGR
jgi:TRAP-type mannitol/chloroaromatic compound transport system substrate-binding protein